MIDLTFNDLKALAKAEREMDAGTSPFVVDSEGQRWSVDPEIMTLLDLVSGQRVPAAVIRAILQGHIAICERERELAAKAHLQGRIE